MLNKPIKIGTRGSPLALKQACFARDQLIKSHHLTESDFEIISIKTSGDKIVDKPLSEFGGKGLFTKEIENALLADEIDMAVHSAKDVATVLPDGLTLMCFLHREDVRDAFISYKALTLMDLSEGAIVGTSSLRRQAFVKNLRPDIQVVTFRGNVQTRLQKLKDGEVDATLLAIAGLNRIGMEDVATSIFEADCFIPAIGQGALCIEVKQENTTVKELLEPINHQKTTDCVTAEREMLKVLEGSCQSPIAGLARIAGNDLVLKGSILSTDGQYKHVSTKSGDRNNPEKVGREVATDLREIAGKNFFENW